MLNDTKTSTKLLVGFASAVLIMLAIGLVGRSGLRTAQGYITSIGGKNMPSVYGLQHMLAGVLHVAAGQRGLINQRMMDSRTASYEEVAKGLRMIGEGRKIYEPLVIRPEEIRLWNAVGPRLEDWQRNVQTVVDVAHERDSLLAAGTKADDRRVLELDERAIEATRHTRQSRMDVNRQLDELVQLNSDLAKQEITESESMVARINTLQLVLAILGTLLATTAGVLVSRSVSRAIAGLRGEATMLTQAAIAGRLSTRADVASIPAEFRGIVQGMNETLDALIAPLNLAADYVDKISKGQIPAKIVDTYHGDFNTIKENLNRCVEAVNTLVADANMLAASAIEGDLSKRADASKHEGDFRKIVEGVNHTLDAVISPVMEATVTLEKLAHYDLRARVNGEYVGDHARIKEAINGTAKALQDALIQVADAVEQVAEASQQIAGSSQAVSQGASEQASSLEETSSSLEQMAGMTKQNADNTIQARSLAQTTKEAAEKGGTAMVRMTDAMEKIRAASEGTAEIIKDINDIAFQTNLLALNAAVEAARAGDAGRGFAVVAEEVRNLALRSKEAAKKTEDLIKVAVGHAENGRFITNEVAGSLTEIVTAAAKVNDIVSEIAVASQEQSRGIEQVNRAVSEMDKVVQTAASNAEESSSAAEELASQSEELSTLVQRFELDRENRAARRQLGATALRRTGLRPATVPPPRRGGNANRNSTKRSYDTSSGRKPTPEELIPLDNDPDFRDF